MKLFRTPTRWNIAKPRTEGRKVKFVEIHRPGYPGLWDYHVTKGWRRSRPGHWSEPGSPTSTTTQQETASE